MITGPRPGEKIHETLVTSEKEHRILESDIFYQVKPLLTSETRKLEFSNPYTSANTHQLSPPELAKLIEGVINSGDNKPLNAHLVPRNSLSKFEMLEIFKETLDRSDISVTPITSPKHIDRRLSTNNQKLNEALWSLADHKSIPDIGDLLRQTLK